MTFKFSFSAYDASLFQAQISKVLEKRTALVSRQLHPNIWRKTDQFNALTIPDEVCNQRRKRNRVYGRIFLLLGAILFLLSLLDPKKLMVLLLAGIFQIVIGVAYLRAGRKKKTDALSRFERAATKLFESYAQISTDHVIFSEDGIRIPDEPFIPYYSIEKVFVTSDFFAFIWNETIIVLQKKDLQTGCEQEFLDFLSAKSKHSFEMVFMDRSLPNGF